MTNTSSFVLVGESTLLIAIVDILLKEKYHISAVVTVDKSCIQYVVDKGVHTITDVHNLKADITCDYVLCVVNYVDLPQTVRKLPRVCCINYHDSPLPKYAGFNATSWALRNGENLYGCNWHVLENLIDSGDIVAEAEFDIKADDTAHSLNLRCYEQAISLFKNLLPNLVGETCERKKQDLSLRSHFRYYERPGPCVINFDDTSLNIWNTYRATLFGEGNYNRWGSIKVYFGGQFYDVRSLTLADDSNPSNSHIPGTIIHADSEVINVTCADGVFQIGLKHHGLRVDPRTAGMGQTTRCLSGDLPADFAEGKGLFENLVRSESYWIDQIRNSCPTDRLLLPPSDTSTNKIPFCHNVNVLITAFLCCIDRCGLRGGNQTTDICVGLHDKGTCPTGLVDLISPIVPFQVSISKAYDAHEQLARVSSKFNDTHANISYLCDLHERHPDCAIRHKYPILVCMDCSVAEAGAIREVHKSNICLVVSRTEETAHILCPVTVAETLVSTIILQCGRFGHASKKKCVVSKPKWQFSQLDNLIDVFEQFQRGSERLVSSPAIKFGDICLSYEECFIKVSILCNVLVEKTQNISIFMPRCPAMVIGAFAILGAGHAFVMLQPDLPENRLNYMREVTESETVLSLTTCKGNCTDSFTRVIMLSACGELVDAVPQSVSKHKLPRSTDTAYILFTSGSTGRPKGAVVPRKALACLSSWMSDVFNFTSQDTLLFKTPCIFDASIWEIIVPFCAGAVVVVAPDGAHAQPAVIAKLLNTDSITLLQLVPSLVPLVANEVTDWDSNALRYLFVGGEALLWSTVGLFESCNFPVVNLYGPTECCVQSLYYVARSSNTLNTPSVPIGTPPCGNAVFLLDNWAQLVEGPLPGELCIAGEQVGDCYIQNEEQTRRHFFSASDFYAGAKDARAYRTGDLVAYVDTETIIYIGRADTQVKLNGQRLEITEIENVVKTIRGVTEAVAVVIDEGAGQALCLLFAPSNVAVKDVESKCEKMLVRYMVPESYVAVDDWNRLPSGKIDRRQMVKVALNHISSFDRIGDISSAFLDTLEMLKKKTDLPSRKLEELSSKSETPVNQLGFNSISLLKLQQGLRQNGLTITVPELSQATFSMLHARLDESNSNTHGSVEDKENPFTGQDNVLVFGGLGFPFIKDLIEFMKCEKVHCVVKNTIEKISDRTTHSEIVFLLDPHMELTDDTIVRYENNPKTGIPLLFLYHLAGVTAFALSPEDSSSRVIGKCTGVIGHSLGVFMAAVVSSSSLGEKFNAHATDMFQVVCALAEGIASEAPRGECMLSLTVKNARRACTYLQHTVNNSRIAIVNSPMRCVVSGKITEVEKLMESLQQDDNLLAQDSLPMTWAGHTEYMRSLCEKIQRECDAMCTWLADTQIPFLCPETGKAIVGQCLGNLCIEMALCTPVDFYSASAYHLTDIQDPQVVDFGPSSPIGPDSRFGIGSLVTEQNHISAKISTIVPSELGCSFFSSGKQSEKGNEGTSKIARVVLIEDVLDCVSSVLGRKVGKDEKLLSMGLTSINAVQLKKEMETILGFSVSLVSFFQHSTCNALYKHFESRGANLCNKEKKEPLSVHCEGSINAPWLQQQLVTNSIKLFLAWRDCFAYLFCVLSYPVKILKGNGYITQHIPSINKNENLLDDMVILSPWECLQYVQGACTQIADFVILCDQLDSVMQSLERVLEVNIFLRGRVVVKDSRFWLHCAADGQIEVKHWSTEKGPSPRPAATSKVIVWEKPQMRYGNLVEKCYNLFNLQSISKPLLSIDLYPADNGSLRVIARGSHALFYRATSTWFLEQWAASIRGDDIEQRYFGKCRAVLDFKPHCQPCFSSKRSLRNHISDKSSVQMAWISYGNSFDTKLQVTQLQYRALSILKILCKMMVKHNLESFSVTMPIDINPASDTNIVGDHLVWTKPMSFLSVQTESEDFGFSPELIDFVMQLWQSALITQNDTTYIAAYICREVKEFQLSGNMSTIIGEQWNESWVNFFLQLVQHTQSEPLIALNIVTKSLLPNPFKNKLVDLSIVGDDNVDSKNMLDAAISNSKIKMKAQTIIMANTDEEISPHAVQLFVT